MGKDVPVGIILKNTSGLWHRSKAVSNRLAVNQVAVFAEPASNDAPTLNATSRRSTRKTEGPKSDRKARRCVVEFETAQGRQAVGMSDGQPGFDVLSRDAETGEELRRIEVKGVQGRSIPSRSTMAKASHKRR